MNDLIEKVKQGLKQHHAGICTEKYGTICPYWGCEASCSKELMADALSVIEEQQAEIERLKAQKQKWLQNIADNQLANAPNEGNTTHEHTYRSGVYMGLQMAWEIMTKDGDGDG